MRIQRVVPVVGAAFFVGCSASLGWFAWKVYEAKPDGNLSGFVTSIAAILAVSGWIVSAWVSMRNSRKQHSINVLFQTRMNTEFQKHLQAIRTRYSPNETFLADPVTEEDKAADKSITFLLNYYEFIAVGIWHGDLDYSIMRDCIRGQLVHTCNRADFIIRKSRGENTFGEPTPEKSLVFKHLIDLHGRWISDGKRASGLR